MEPLAGATLYRARFLLPITSPPIEDGAIVVAGGSLLAVGRCHELRAAYPDATVIDFGDAVLLPPMVNAHTHLELTSFPTWAAAAGEAASPQSFVDWILWLVRVRRQISEEEFSASLTAGLQAALSAGTGAIGDICTSLGVAAAYRRSPLRGRIFAEVLGHEQALVAERLAAIGALARNRPGPFLEWGLSPHAPYTLSAASTEQVFAFARRESLQCAMHLAESQDETAFLHNGTGAIAEKLYAAARWNPAVDAVPGCTSVRALCRAGRLHQGDLVVHGVQVVDEDVALLKRSGCSLVLCPRSNAALNVGKAPLAAYLKAGVPLALGTDSLASCDSLSLWDELAFASEWFPGAAQPRDWLAIATLGGASALGLTGRVGRLLPSDEASFQVVRLPSLPTLTGLEEALCSAGREVKVSHLFLAAQNFLPES